MLVRIATEQLRVGMFVHAMDCSWWQNPFWQSRFLLSSDADRQVLIDSGIRHVTIDDDKGDGVAPQPSPAALAPPAAEALPPSARVHRRRAPRDEVSRAAEIVSRSKAAVTSLFREARLGRAISPDQAAPLVDEIAASVARDASAMIKVTRLKTKNEYTYLHSVAVCALMINLARGLKLGEDEARQLGLAGLLHDIGKMGVPEAVLDKSGPLDAAEQALVRLHPEHGHALLDGSDGVTALALDVCLHHHERIDGRGYPHGLRAEEISVAARMGAICDVYDAITSDRPYKKAWSPADALARMLSWEGHFDPAMLQTFIASIGISPLGGLVRLRSNRLAMVVGANDADPTLPVVRAFYAIPEQQFVAPADVDMAMIGDTEAVVQPEQGAVWFGEHWPLVATFLDDGRQPPASLNPTLKLRATAPSEPRRATG